MQARGSLGTPPDAGLAHAGMEILKWTKTFAQTKEKNGMKETQSSKIYVRAIDFNYKLNTFKNAWLWLWRRKSYEDSPGLSWKILQGFLPCLP